MATGKRAPELRLKGFDGFVRRCMKSWDVPGAAIGIVTGTRTIYARSFGLRDVKRRLPVTDRTLFPIGSCTKAFTATAVGILVDEGVLEWDRPVQDYMPSFRMHDPVATRQTTPRDLLAHRCGLPRHLGLLYGPRGRDELIEKLPHLPPSKGFRAAFQYTNLTYLAAGLLIEHVTGKTWEQFVRERIFVPLGMTSSTFTADVAHAGHHLAVGYAKEGRRVVRSCRGWARNLDLAALYRPCGADQTIVSTLADMVRWVRFQIEGGRAGRRSIVSEASLGEIHRPQIPAPGWYCDGTERLDASYAMGWFVQPYRGHRLVFHGGSGCGFSSQVSFLPDESVGLVVLTNALSSPLRTIVSLCACDRLLGLEAIRWNARFGRMTARRQGEAKSTEAPRRRQRGVRPPRPLTQYVGEYRHPGYGRLSVYLDRGRLTLRADLAVFRLKHDRDDVFKAVGRPFEDWEERTSFHVDAAGNVTAVSIPLEPALDEIVFERVEQP